MKISREEGSSREAVLSIELEPQDIEPYLDRAYRRVVTRFQVPGFRKGKAPRAILENFMGRDVLLREALDFLVPESLDKAIEEEGLETFGLPDMELAGLDPVSIKARVPLTPEVDLGDYQSLRRQREPVIITEAQVDQVVEQLREEVTPWEPVSRPVSFGDLVNIEVEGTVEGRQVINDRGVDFIPRQDNLFPVPGFSVHLEGMSPSEEKEFTLSFPDDYRDTSLAGKECRFHLKVLSLKGKNLPEIDDDFARTVGDGYEDLADMRTKARERLTADAERATQQRFRDSLLEEVVKGAGVEMSPLLLEREVDHLLEDQEQALKQRRIDMDTYLQQVGKSREEIREELRPQAEERVKLALVIREIAKRWEIKVEPEEVDAELDQMASAAGASGDALRRAFSSSDGRRSLASAILRRKVLQRLEETAIQEESPKEASPDEAAPQELQKRGGSSDV